MKIKNFIPEWPIHNGLKLKEMRGLKQMVGLFGKNGAGKTRILSLLENQVHNRVGFARNMKVELDDLGKERTKETGWSQQKEDKYQELKSKWEKLCSDIDFEFNEQIIRIRPLKLAIQEPDMVDSEYRAHSQNLLTNPRYEDIKPNALRLIKAFCKSEISQKFYAEYPDTAKYYLHHDNFVKQNIETLKLIQELVQKIMNKTLSYATDEHLIPMLLLNDHHLELRELSLGEMDLLAYCVYIAVQTKEKILNETVSLKGKTLLLDEPDIFLHPQAQIELINGLRNIVGESGQIWVATHSLTILSMLKRDEIWLVEDGDVVSPSIETPGKILNSIVGEENIDALENFLSSQYEWSSIQFALESLFPPPVSDYKEVDPQQNQVIERLSNPSKQLKILDFGAGQGRIAQEILRNTNVAKGIYYQPLEENSSFHNQLASLTQQLQQISSINSSKEREVLDSYEKLNGSQYKEFFDYVLLINVLHELPVNKWGVILNSIFNSLNADGKIIILEDQAIPKGENAHEYGFLILNVEELKILFSLENSPIAHKHTDQKYSDRLTCVEIPKSSIKVTNDTIIEAFERKKTNCKTEIKKLKNKAHKVASDGRKNAFLTQLYANTDMAITDLRGGR